MAQRRIKAAYRTVGPRKVTVHVNKCIMDKETKSLEQKMVEEVKEMYMVYFPRGHSIRVDYAELKRLGYHLRPRMVDIDTGDVVDVGGDPYDFGGGAVEGFESAQDDADEFHLTDDDIKEAKAKG